MGTEAQKAHRAAYNDRVQSLIDAATKGQWNDDASLKSYLKSIGANDSGALFNQFGSEGGYATFGPSWNPLWKNDFNTNEEIPNMGEGETWYDPSVASNWSKTDPLKTARMNNFYQWRDQNKSSLIDPKGGNAFATWYNMRGKSNRPNSPDMSWWNEGNKGIPTADTTGTTGTTPDTTGPDTQGSNNIKTQSVDPAITGNTGLPVPDPAKGTSVTGTNKSATTSTRRTPAWYSTWRY
jgi:hypothetical protein